MTQPVTRTKDYSRSGLALRHVWGLNIFEANGVEGAGDPLVSFLRAVAVQYACSAHVGVVWGDFDKRHLEEFLAETRQPIPIVYTPVVPFYTEFYLTEDTDGCFFPSIPLTLLDHCGARMLFHSQLALYVGRKGGQ